MSAVAAAAAPHGGTQGAPGAAAASPLGAPEGREESFGVIALRRVKGRTYEALIVQQKHGEHWTLCKGGER